MQASSAVKRPGEYLEGYTLDGMLVPGSTTEVGQEPGPSAQRGGIDATPGHRWSGASVPLELTRNRGQICIYNAPRDQPSA